MNKQDKHILKTRLNKLVDILRGYEYSDRLRCLCPGENCDDEEKK